MKLGVFTVLFASLPFEAALAQDRAILAAAPEPSTESAGPDDGLRDDVPGDLVR